MNFVFYHFVFERRSGFAGDRRDIIAVQIHFLQDLTVIGSFWVQLLGS
jgi:hypothetical protein